MAIKKRWLIFVGTAVVVYLAFQAKMKVSSQESLIKNRIEKLSEEPKVAPLVTPPPLPTPTMTQQDLAMAKRIAGAGLTYQKMKSDRDSFMRRHKLSYPFSDDLIPLLSKNEKYDFETLSMAQNKQVYQFWISVYEKQNSVAKLIEDLTDALEIPSDDFKEIEKPVSRQFQVEGAYEYESIRATNIMVILRHPNTKKLILLGFRSRLYNKSVEKIMNRVFESLKSLQ